LATSYADILGLNGGQDNSIFGSGSMSGFTLPDYSSTLGVPSIGGGVGGGNFLGISGLGANMDTLKLGLSGLGSIANIWGAFSAANLAKKQFNLQKQAYQTNLANQIKSYNTNLDSTERSRAAVEGQTAAQQAAYIAANKLGS
jgi:hypothetical protein